MNTKRDILKKSKEVKRGSKSRIQQLEDKMDKDKKLKEEEYLEDDGVEDFIEKDIYQEDRNYKLNNKKLKSNATKHYKPKKNIPNKNKMQKEKQYKTKLDIDSKNLMQNLLKKKSNIKKKNTDTNFENALKNLQKNYTNSESKNKRAPQLRQKKNFLLTSQKIQQKKTLTELEKERKNILFFQTEIVKDSKDASILYLFGKTKKNNQFINTCIKVTNIMREIYVMPKEGHNIEEVKEEIENLISNSKSKKFEINFEIVKKKYCFELDVDFRNVETEVLKISFSFKNRTLNFLRQIGKSYKGVFGVNNQALELFMLQNKIQGSCWLNISDYTVKDDFKFAPNMLNIEIDEYRTSVKMNDEQFGIPKFNLCTFEIDYNHNINEIDSICYAIFYDYDINSSSYKTMDQIIFKKDSIDTNFRANNNNENQIIIKEFNNEYQLLANFHIVFANTDPDIIVGHELLSFTMEVYIQRVRAKLFDIDHFSRLLVKQKLKNNENLKYRLRALSPGRLFVDIYELAKTSIKLESYSLYDMYGHFFGKQNQKADLITKFSENSKNILKIADKLKLLPLTLQLSKVAGCLWEMSLRQSRAERNEVLLLNEFYHKNYIIPDGKTYSKNSKKKSKSKYSGGKVFDPKINFYNTYVILVDFNSLYPSIIRQFKICFTTVKRNLIEPGYESAQNEEIDLEFTNDPEGPLNQIECKSETEPLLPLILNRLINKRKLVKRELKKTKNLKISNKELEVQLDIKQQAYKLIANSIYGCLGFSFSRFYAKKMAMLVTCFGRKLLESSRALVEKMGYEVIYGDTDSIMINTMKKNLKMAILDGLTMKKEINRQFHKKKGEEQILEVEIDGVYKKMLLLRKKKYAGLMILNFNEIVKSRKTIAEVEKMEIKGLDLVRRDWSKLTKDVSRKVLDIIMQTGGDLSDINTYLEKVNKGLDKFGNKNKENEIKNPKIEKEDPEEEPYIVNVGKFIIKRQLNKKTHEYNQSSSYPHVKVAMDMKKLFKKKEEQLINHFIPFIICKKGDSLSEKANHPSVYMQSQSSTNPLTIDLTWYKRNQLINPIERLLNPIDGFLIESLNKVFGFKVEEREVNTNIDQVNQIYDRVMDNTPLNYRKITLDFNDYSQKCGKCDSFCYSFLVECQNAERGKEYNEAEYENRVVKSVSHLVQKYSSVKFGCEDCDFICNMVLYSKSCPKCKRESLKRIDSVFVIIGKMLYLKKLCEITIGKSDHRDRFMFVLKHIDKVLNGFEYESRNVLKLFKVYSKQYSGNEPVSLIKLI